MLFSSGVQLYEENSIVFWLLCFPPVECNHDECRVQIGFVQLWSEWLNIEFASFQGLMGTP